MLSTQKRNQMKWNNDDLTKYELSRESITTTTFFAYAVLMMSNDHFSIITSRWTLLLNFGYCMYSICVFRVLLRNMHFRLLKLLPLPLSDYLQFAIGMSNYQFLKLKFENFITVIGCNYRKVVYTNSHISFLGLTGKSMKCEKIIIMIIYVC
jgi:hypothetical protein